MFESLTITNFRCIAQADIPLRPLTAFVGKNGTGKSWALRALARAELSARGGVYTLQDGDVPVSARARGQMELRLRFGRGRHEFAEVADFDPQHHIESPKRIVDGADAATDSTPLFPSMQSRKPHRFIRFDAEALRTPWPYSPAVTQLSDRGAGLPAVVQHLLNHERGLLEDVEAALRRQYPGFLSVALDVDSANMVHLRFKFEGADEPLHAADVSDGLLLSLAFQILCRDVEPAGVILLEEPENGLDPGQLGELVAALRLLSSGRFGTPVQVVMASHSPVLLGYLSPDEVVWFHRSADGTTSAVGLVAVEELDELREELSETRSAIRLIDGTAGSAGSSAQESGERSSRGRAEKTGNGAGSGNGHGPRSGGRRSGTASNGGGNGSGSKGGASGAKRTAGRTGGSNSAASTAQRSRRAAAKSGSTKSGPAKQGTTGKATSAAKSGGKASASSSAKNGAKAKTDSPKAPAAAKPRAAANSRASSKAAAGKSTRQPKRAAPAKGSGAKGRTKATKGTAAKT